MDLVGTWGKVMLVSLTEITYVDIILALPSVSFDHFVLSASLDMCSQSLWLGSLESPDSFAKNFLSDKSIMEVMSLEEVAWNNTHHRSSFLPSLALMSTCLENFSL